MISSAHLLVAHGSRNSDYQMSLQKLAHLVRQQLRQKEGETQLNTSENNQFEVKQTSGGLPLIDTAYLELGGLSLSEAMVNFAYLALSQNYQFVKIIPLFLLSGVHLREDIPAQLKLARQELKDRIDLELMPHLGSYQSLVKLLQQQFRQLPSQKRILLAHGSCLATGNQKCEQIAAQLEAELAYWSISPSLAEKVASLRELGIQSIAIIPYFLFEGKITQAIASQIEYLQKQYPQLQLLGGKPLGATRELANVIVHELELKWEEKINNQ
jgi:sirohydrochlorin ferrochelatase